MDPIYTWAAELECEDVGELEAVVRVVHWRCTAQEGGRDATVCGVAVLGDPNPAAFLPAPEGVTSGVIRGWVGEAATQAEAAALADLVLQAGQTPRQRLAAPPALALYAHARSNVIVGRLEWDGETALAVDGILIRSSSMPAGWKVGWRHTEAGWEPPEEPGGE